MNYQQQFEMKQIATILTVFNRKQKTLSCLQHLFAAVETYNQNNEEKDGFSMTVFST